MVFSTIPSSRKDHRSPETQLSYLSSLTRNSRTTRYKSSRVRDLFRGRFGSFFRPCDVTQCGCNQNRIPVFERRFQVCGHILLGFQMFRWSQRLVFRHDSLSGQLEPFVQVFTFQQLRKRWMFDDVRRSRAANSTQLD